MKYFVKEDSVVRDIWGKADTILFIFAAAAAEFAVNKAVDWLYFTGRLPADPLERLFSTVTYAQRIIYADYEEALNAIDQITAIHKQVEAARNSRIPDWAYRDVLFMLIDYSIRSYELLDRKLTIAEKEEVYSTFKNVGLRMELKGLPTDYNAWTSIRQQHLDQDIERSSFTADLFKQYRKHVGALRFILLKQVQALMAPEKVKNLLAFKPAKAILPVLYLYKLTRKSKLQLWLMNALLPAQYRAQVHDLNIAAR